jgi:2-polyprenyl-6-methoxyphenol hydroxylase-like FAD-dependent oxidoreductase
MPSATTHPQADSAVAGHAIVIGSSIAGLLAARVLSEHFARVTIVERDRLPDTLEFRRGTPQARHAHTLLPDGQLVLEQLFPGLVDELLLQGAIAIDAVRDIVFFQAGAWHIPRPRAVKVSIACSRPLLDAAVYGRVAARSNVHVMQGYETIGLSTTEGRQRVAGVRLRSRGRAEAAEMLLAGDVVVDASGRGSQAPRWLYSLGYAPPEEWTVNSFTGYATRLYQRPGNFAGGWKTLYLRPSLADGPRGGVIVPMEGDRWQVTLFGMAGDYPPTDEAGFLAFARSLPSPRLYEAIEQAEPLTRPIGFRRTENRVRRFDKLPRYLEGFLVCGDAAYALNPTSSAGMTAAALGSVALDKCLRAHRPGLSLGDVSGLAETFQRQLSEALSHLWYTTTQKEWQWPLTEVTDTVFQPDEPALPPAGTSHVRSLMAQGRYAPVAAAWPAVSQLMVLKQDEDHCDLPAARCARFGAV